MTGKYLWLQIKRAWKVFPAMLLTTLILAGGLGAALGMIVKINLQEEQKQKVRIGIVGDAKESYLGIGIDALQQLDSSRFTVIFEEITRNEAETALKQGELSAYVLIPEGFVESVVQGENLPITYVTADKMQGINGALMKELLECISTLITESQNGIYGMQQILTEEEKTKDFWKNTDELNLKYIKTLLNREDIYEMQLLGYFGQLSFVSYYACGMLVLFLLLWGMNGSHLFIKKDTALIRLLVSRNISIPEQIAAEYCALFLLMSASLLCVGAAAMTGMELAGMKLPEWQGTFFEEKVFFFLKILPAVAAISALQFLLYELVSEIISGILLQFTAAMGLGYLSGCFYPIAFFPEKAWPVLQNLPAGKALQYIGRCLLKEPVGKEALLLAGYGVIFLFLAGIIRKRKVARL